jgi:ABC-type transport system involved in multi-copper enzyme maturation permease subunit
MRDWFAKLDRVQKSRLFKLIATAVLVLAGAGAFVSVWLSRTPYDPASAPALELRPDIKVGGPEGVTEEDLKAAKSDIEKINLYLQRFSAGQGDLTSVAVGISAGVGLLVGAVWLGMGLTVLGLLAAGGLVVAPLAFYRPTANWGRLLGGLLALTLSFAVVMRLLNLLLAAPGVIFAVARNVLAEATRLKLSVIFIGMLLFTLAATPMLLNPENPLRYRVQAFLQYSTGGTFWIVALLVVLFSVSTVATEQRDKVIWQTMTKPVRAWQYVLGKWLGVVTLAAALLTVSGTGVFLFVEFLRNQPAKGEAGPFKPAAGVMMTEDRQWLESQVLTARVSVENDPLDLGNKDPQTFAQVLDNYLAEIKKTNSAFDINDPKNRFDVAISLEKALEANYRTVDAAPVWRTYTFRGLSEARDKGLPLIFRYRVDSGSNAPDKVFKVTFGMENYGIIVKDAPLGQYQTMQLPPTVVRDDGTVELRVFNGALNEGGGRANPETIAFPKEGLVMSYSVGSYRINFIRVMFSLWVKLAFLAMAGVFAGTFLSFPVATLVSFGVFGMAESASMLQKALEVFDDRDNANKVVAWKWVVVRISEATSGLFRAYGDLQPTKRLVDGMLLSWTDVATGMAFLAVLTVVLFAVATAIFRRRELAIYSGQ